MHASMLRAMRPHSVALPAQQPSVHYAHVHQTARAPPCHMRRAPATAPRVAARSPAGAWLRGPLQHASVRSLHWPAAVADGPAPVSSTPPADLEATCVRCSVLNVAGDVAEELSDVLLSLGAQSVVLEEHRPAGAPEQEIFDDGQQRLWDRCNVVAHFALEHDVEATLAVAVDALGLESPLEHVVAPVPNEAWVQQIKDSYVPLQISDDLWILPEWADTPRDASALNIVLQPGVAFGTGEHPTTRLCLRVLQQLRANLQGARVMDYGTGSGVLAIAALMMGAAEAAGTDIDSLAVRAAVRNAELNGLGPQRFKAYQCGEGIDAQEPLAAAGVAAPDVCRAYDLVVANILRGPLIELQPRLTGYAKPGALLVLSGILAEQVPDIQAAYSGAFEGFEVRADTNWAVVTARRRAQ